LDHWFQSELALSENEGQHFCSDLDAYGFDRCPTAGTF